MRNLATKASNNGETALFFQLAPDKGVGCESRDRGTVDADGGLYNRINLSKSAYLPARCSNCFGCLLV